VLLGVELEPGLVQLPVEVDRELGDPQQWTVVTHQAGLHPTVDGQAHPAGETEVPIQPGVEEHAAVDLDPQLVPRAGHGIRARLDPEVGAVGVGSDDPEAGSRGCGPDVARPRHEAAAPHDEVTPGSDGPRIRLVDPTEADRLELSCCLGHRMERGWSGLDEGQEFTGVIQAHVFGHDPDLSDHPHPATPPAECRVRD
jgi:hypothetical protein